MTVKRAAEYLKVHPLTLKRWDRLGILVPERIGNRNGYGDRNYTKEQLDAFLQKKTEEYYK